ncbi:cytochrome c3 family protein [Leptospira ryugenii]|uniref:cytochrome c3 family protein n=1 Tax=Leptospira ryugenii TaxID=1917863 RepID=UPI000D595FF2|nr:cytochrome c3 family protein [Leptospira ryugenii]
MNIKILKISVPIVAVAALAYLIFSPSRYVGYAPNQPIPFNHKIHAGDNKIDCKYCHTTVETSAHATVPPSSTCMNCHKGGGNVAGNQEHVKWLVQQYDNNVPVAWVKVHDQPDFVYFNHSRHVQRGVDCSQCHGNMAEMVKVRQSKSLNMGFCVDCHRENNAPNDCSTCHR